MKITFVLPGTFIAGGVRAIFECANGLQERGHTVNIVYPAALLSKSAGFSLRRMLSLPREFLKPNTVSWFPLKARLVRVFSLEQWAVPFIENSIPDADIIVASTWESAYTVAKLSRIKGKKAYFVQHYEATWLWDDNECWKLASAADADPKRIFLAMSAINPPSPELLEYKEKIDKSYALPLAKFTTSRLLEDMITERFGQKSFGRVPIGNNLQTFYPEGQKAGDNVILIPFRGTGWKGGTDIIEMLRLLRAQRTDFKVVMYGYEGFRKLVPQWVDFRGSVSDAELRRLYSHADIFVSPTWVEGWCSPPMEAMSCRTACVSTDVGAVSEYAADGETALIVPARSPEKLARAVERLLDDKILRGQIACAGYAAIQRWTWKRAVDSLEEILSSVLTGLHTSP